MDVNICQLLARSCLAKISWPSADFFGLSARWPVVQVGCEAVRFMSPVPAAKQNQLKRIAGAKFQPTPSGSFIRDFALCRRRLLRRRHCGSLVSTHKKKTGCNIIDWLEYI